MQHTHEKNKSLIGDSYIKELITATESAQRSIDITAFDWRWYSNDFTKPVALFNQAIVRAVRRGVKVRAFLHAPVPSGDIAAQGVLVRHANMTSLMHAKMLFFDRSQLFIGSHNLTGNAQQRNLEVSVCTTDPILVEPLMRYFDSIWQS